MGCILRRQLLFWGLSLAAVFLSGFGPPTLLDRPIAPSHRLTVGQLRLIEIAGTPPPISGRALVVYDVDANRVLMAQNSDLALPPASLTKLMTALLVLERGSLQELVTIQPDDLIGGASMGLQAGEVVTVEALLWGLLIPSGNDAAMALARHLAGTVDVFVQRMNTRAAELGLAQTRFANPHGLDAAGHTSGAADLLELARLNLQYPLFREIVATASTTVAGHELRSTNQLLGSYPGVDGIKTGTTTAAGQCLIASINRDGHQVLTVVLGSADRYGDTQILDAAYQSHFAWSRGFNGRRLTALDRIRTEDGILWLLEPTGETPDVFLPKWSTARLRPYRRLQLPPAPDTWSPGLTAGTLEWRLGEQVVGTQTLVLR